MQMLHPNDLQIVCNDNFCIIYHVPTGSLKSVTLKHAELLNNILIEYHGNTLSDANRNDFECYIIENFGTTPKEIICPPGLDKKRTLSKLEIMISTTCNMNCLYCYAEGGHYNYPKMIMTPAQISSYLDAVVSRFNEINTIFFFGGEPSLAPETIIAGCEKIYNLHTDKLIKKIPRFTMVTNGTNITPSLGAAIKKYQIDVTISLDGPKKINDKLRIYPNGKGTYDDIVSGINTILNSNAKVNMFEATYTSVHEKFGFTRKDISEYLSNVFGVKKVLVDDCYMPKNSENEYLMPRNTDETQELLEGLSNLERVKDVAELLASLSSKCFYDLGCTAGISSFAVLPDGILFPCHMFVKSKSWKLGRIDNGTLTFENYRVHETRLLKMRKSTHPQCSSCFCRNTCFRCPAEALLESNGIQDVDSCTKKRKLTEKDLLGIVMLRSEPSRWEQFVQTLNSFFNVLSS